MSAFSKIIENEAEENDSVIFDPYFMESLMKNVNGGKGFFMWPRKNEICSKRVWVIPYNTGGHWTTIVVAFPIKTIFVIDALKSHIPKGAISKLCHFVNMIYKSEEKFLGMDGSCFHHQTF